MEASKQLIKKAKHIVILTGAGISSESGIPTFRGKEGIWNSYKAENLATSEAFQRNPVLVWSFYNYRRNIVRKCTPNAGHYAISALQKKKYAQNNECSIITQNIDRLHYLAGNDNIIELHGNLWLIKPFDEPTFVESPGKVWLDTSYPVIKEFEKEPEKLPSTSIQVSQLPHYKGKLLRPSVVWFGEALDDSILNKTSNLLKKCDLFLVIGTSSVVYPAAGFAQSLYKRNIPIIEVNLEETNNTKISTHSFIGKSGEILPKLFDVEIEVDKLLSLNKIRK